MIPGLAVHVMLALEAAAMKKTGIPIGSFQEVKDAAGKSTLKPKVRRKTSVSQKIAQRKSKKITVARKGQMP